MEKDELMERWKKNSEMKKLPNISEKCFRQLHLESLTLVQLIKDKRKGTVCLKMLDTFLDVFFDMLSAYTLDF